MRQARLPDPYEPNARYDEHMLDQRCYVRAEFMRRKMAIVRLETTGEGLGVLRGIDPYYEARVRWLEAIREMRGDAS